MCNRGTIATGFAALALALVGAEGAAWAKDAAHVVPSMTPETDPVVLQSAVLAWITATATSVQFIVGVVCGVALAAAASLAWTWTCRVFGGAKSAADFIVRHRLIVVFLAFASYYVTYRYLA